MLNTQIYECTIENLNCSQCTQKLQSSLANFLSIQKLTIDLLSKKIHIYITNKDDLDQIQSKIINLNFKISSQFTQINISQQNNRKIYFKFSLQLSFFTIKQSLLNIFPQILQVNLTQLNIIEVQYNPSQLKAFSILKYLQKAFQVTAYNPYISIFQPKLSSISSKESEYNQALFSLISTIVLVMLLPHLFPWLMAQQSYICIVILLMACYFVFFGQKILRNCWINLFRHQEVNMESLICIGSISSLLMFVFQSAFYQVGNAELLHTLCTAPLIFIISAIGKYKESQAKQNVLGVSQQLFRDNKFIQESTVEYIEDFTQKVLSLTTIDIQYVDQGDFIYYKSPFRILNDVTVVHIPPNKHFYIQDQLLYGQNRCFYAKEGQLIKSGADIISGEGVCQVNKSIENSILYTVCQQLDFSLHSQQCKEDGISILCQKFSQKFVQIIFSAAILAFLIWFILIKLEKVHIQHECVLCFPIQKFISILVVSCPCAIGLAIPCALQISLNVALKKGILIKKNNVFAQIGSINTVVFDKTGTILQAIDQISTFINYSEDLYTAQELWEIIKCTEKGTSHPIAMMLYEESLKRTALQVKKYDLVSKNVAINGLQCELKSQKEIIQEIHMGNISFLESNNIFINPEIKKKALSLQKQANSVILMSINFQIVCLISIDNIQNLRPECKQVISQLQKSKKDVYILSGDKQETVQHVGRFLNIQDTNLLGEYDQQQKLDFIKGLKEQKKGVMMIGDGLNDILALQEADIGVCINAFCELNLFASDIMILDGNLRKILDIFQIVQGTNTVISINLFWAFCYNILMVPIAGGSLYYFGIGVSPLVSTLMMCVSSIVVVMFSRVVGFLGEELEVKQVEKVENYGSF